MKLFIYILYCSTCLLVVFNQAMVFRELVEVEYYSVLICPGDILQRVEEGSHLSGGLANQLLELFTTPVV